MNIEQFNQKFFHLKDVDKVLVDELCNHPQHKLEKKEIAKGPAKRNILKHGGQEFICRACDMHYNNPMLKAGQGRRQSDEKIIVICPHPEHIGDKSRKMKISCYYGEMKTPYQQICGSCAQLHKIISEDQKKAISKKLEGRQLTEEHKKNIGIASKQPERLIQAIKNLKPELGRGWNKGMSTPQEVRDKIAKGNQGKKRTLQQRLNVSIGRKKMLDEQGGFTIEHRMNLSKKTIEQYKNGFNPQTHHLRGWHYSPKLNMKIFYRSSYEKKAYLILDADPLVANYSVEAVNIVYFNPEKEIDCEYLIDLQVSYTDRTVKLIEIKPKKWLSDWVIQAKIKAANQKAAELDLTFEVWTEENLFGSMDEKIMRDFTNSLRSEKMYETKSSLLERIQQEFEQYGKHYKLIDWDLDHYSYSEALVWVVWEKETKEIFLDAIYFTFKNDNWACGDGISELECPVANTCPQRLLDLTPKEINPYYNEDWRNNMDWAQ